MKFRLILISFLFLQTCKLISQETWTSMPVIGGPSPRLLHTSVYTGSVMIIWGGQSNLIDVNTGAKFDFSANSWSSTTTVNAPVGRELHTAVWTGSKMIVWGGWEADSINLIFQNTGGLYDPVANSWEAVSTINAPTPRTSHTAVWTGSKMIIWGGFDPNVGFTNTGAIYDPATDSWTTMSTVNAPLGRDWHTAVWTGTRMIVWGGEALVDTLQTLVNTGGIYDPVSDSWSETSTTNAPPAKMQHTAVWTGSRMIVWGVNFFGGSYDPVSNSWASISYVNAPTPGVCHQAIWTGTKMIIWGGAGNGMIFNTGGIYDPIADSWVHTTMTNVPQERFQFSAVWTGSKMVVWGGGGYIGPLNSGGIYYNQSVIGIEKINENIPVNYSLSQNYPNPFNPTTKFRFGLPKASMVTIEIFDIVGRVVTTLAKNEFKYAGTYDVNWDASNFTSGVYFYRLQADGFTDTKKMVVVK